MSQSCFGNESNNVMEEENVAPSFGDTNIQAVQPSPESGSLSMGNDTFQSVRRKSRTKPLTVDVYTVQCNCCYKWRLIPSLQKYEEIREQIIENPFMCKSACEWEPGMSCDVPETISQDGTRIWALDKPKIPRPPPKWTRLVQIREEGCSQFSDVYYITPYGQTLRSSVEIQKYLENHPKFVLEGVTPSQFSFQMPTPLEENYVRKRPAQSSKRKR
ncbi:unnamed protein product [Thlaspi arvense]|uniref:Methyl-CPG-binding domain protein 02 n=1 Tax=Thlaspi arvense TaxID=13288 RepID=A0AAU9T5J7_THLAR|nr:unnamed protein product [Thlaspi arvense]